MNTTLRPAARDDAQALVDIYKDEDSPPEYVKDVESARQQIEAVTEWPNFPKNVRPIQLIAADLSGNVVGHATFGFAKDDETFVEISYQIHRNFRRRGHGKELARLAVKRAFETLKGIGRVIANVKPCNTGSVAIIKSLGMKRIESRRDGEDTYEITRDEFSSPRAQY